MAIVVDSSTAWADDTNYDHIVTSPSFDAGAGTVIVAVFSDYATDSSAAQFSNSGTALTWNTARIRNTAGGSVGAVYAVNSSAQTGITVTYNKSADANSYPSLKVYVLSGANTSSPLGVTTAGTTTGTSITVPTSSTDSTASGSLLFVTAQNQNYSAMTSSDLTYSSTSSLNYAMAGYETLGTAPVSLSSNITSPVSGTVAWALFEIKPGGTSHTADATRATTATITAEASVTRVATASVATSAALSATAEVVKPTSADVATTATITASASVVRSAAVDLATTAAIDASATVETPGVQTADATVATTATITAEASVTRSASADVATTATITAAGTVTQPSVQTGTADVVTTATITASATVTRSATADLAATVTITATPAGITTRGTMRPIDRATARIRPTGTTGTTIRTHVVAFDRATMRAVLDDYAAPAPGGVLCFVGPDDPVTVGLVAPGVAHLWFHDGTVSEREGT